jgi:hypothetical protein
MVVEPFKNIDFVLYIFQLAFILYYDFLKSQVFLITSKYITSSKIDYYKGSLSWFRTRNDFI